MDKHTDNRRLDYPLVILCVHVILISNICVYIRVNPTDFIWYEFNVSCFNLLFVTALALCCHYKWCLTFVFVFSTQVISYALLLLIDIVMSECNKYIKVEKSRTASYFNCQIVDSDVLSWIVLIEMEMKWNESGFRPPLCTYRLNWTRITS